MYRWACPVAPAAPRDSRASILRLTAGSEPGTLPAGGANGSKAAAVLVRLINPPKSLPTTYVRSSTMRQGRRRVVVPTTNPIPT